MAVEQVLCCFNEKNALYLEKINLSITSIGLFLNIFKLCAVPWGGTSYTMEFLGVLTFIFLACNLILVFLFFLLRLKNMVNDYNFKACLYSSCAMIILSLFSFLCETLSVFIVLEDLYYTSRYLVSDAEWLIAFLTIFPSAIFWFVISMLWVSEYLRVNVKTSGNYLDYINDNDIIIIKKRGKNGNKSNKNKNEKNNNNDKKEKEGRDDTTKSTIVPKVNITYA